MKDTIKAVLCFGLLFFLSSGKVRALDPVYDIRFDKEIKIIPTNTPTPTNIIIKPIKDIDIDIMPLATKTPTPVVVTQVVTATPEPSGTITESKPTVAKEVTPEPDLIEDEETPDDEVEEETEIPQENVDKAKSDKLFWGITIGLMVVILGIQIWSTQKRDKEDNSEN